MAEVSENQVNIRDLRETVGLDRRTRATLTGNARQSRSKKKIDAHIGSPGLAPSMNENKME